MRNILILAAVVFATIAPFLNRAVFIDEHIFLRLARSALQNPFFPADTPVLFAAIELPNYASHTHPPIGEYYLAVVYMLIGQFDEVAFRLLFAIFPVAAIVSFYFLSRRFVREPLIVASLLAVSPAFLVMAPTLMMDIPMLAFLLGGLALYFHGRYFFAAVCFVLAVGTGYTALVPLGCMTLVMTVSRRPWKELACVAAAPVVLGFWLLMMTLHFGSFPLAGTAEYLLMQGLLPKSATQIIADQVYAKTLNMLGILSFLGGVTVFPGSIRLQKRLAWLGALVLASFLSLPVTMPSFAYRAWFILLAMCGIMILAAFAGAASRVMQPGAKNAGEAIFILWAPSVLLFFAIVGEMVTARYILLALPALYLILFRETSRAELTAVFVPTLALSLVLAHADARFVNRYKTWVTGTIPELQKDGFTVFSASESGLRFYLEAAGVETLSKDSLKPSGSDLVVRQAMFAHGLAEDVEVVLTPLVQHTLEDGFPLRTFNPAAGAGFHDSRFGIVPYFVSRAPHDTLTITQVNPLVQKLPQGSTDPHEVPVYGPRGPVFFQSQPEIVFPMTFPSNVRIQYELEGGSGFAEKAPHGLRLVKTSDETVVWRRLRVVPSKLVETSR